MLKNQLFWDFSPTGVPDSLCSLAGERQYTRWHSNGLIPPLPGDSEGLCINHSLGLHPSTAEISSCPHSWFLSSATLIPLLWHFSISSGKHPIFSFNLYLSFQLDAKRKINNLYQFTFQVFKYLNLYIYTYTNYFNLHILANMTLLLLLWINP